MSLAMVPPRFSPERQLDILMMLARNLMDQRSVEDLLWFVAENVVAELGYIDCVIYRFDGADGLLRQQAAIGAKSPTRRKILNPLTFHVRFGVTGACARTRMPILLEDAAAHPDYVHDIAEPGSELCVPIMHDGLVLGVIDCEHPQKGWFTHEDVEILTSIAKLTASQWLQCELITSLEARTERLIAAEAQARAASRAQSRFLDTMSHELRAPFTAAAPLFEALRADPLTKTQEAALVSIERGVRRVDLMLDSVFDITAIDGERLKLKSGPVCLTTLLKDMEEIFRLQAEAKGVSYSSELDADTPDTVVTDERVLSKLALHLIGNAVKFTEKGAVSVRLWTCRRGLLRLSVSDSGPGLDRAEQMRVFEPFERGERARREGVPGAGVGLALCRRLAEHAGGRTGVESAPGKGSTFWVELPVELG